MLVVWAHHEIVIAPPLDHALSFGLHDGVNAADLVANLPGKLEEETRFVEVREIHDRQWGLRLLNNLPYLRSVGRFLKVKKENKNRLLALSLNSITRPNLNRCLITESVRTLGQGSHLERNPQ